MKNKKVIAIAIVIVVIIVAIIVGVVVKVNNKPEPTPAVSTDVSEDQPEVNEPTNPAIPVDFATLQAEYPEIYAWINIPDTNVDFPIVQSPEGKDDDYYLRRDLDGSYKEGGTIYTQASLNTKDMTDKVILIYGHDMNDKTMFGRLEEYTKSDFREDHSTIYIYTPEHIYTYELAFAVTFSDAHVLYKYDPNNDDAGYQEFLNDIKTDEFAPRWINEDIELTTEDQIIILSTCNSVEDQRYLIGAKLVSVEEGVYTPQEETEK